MFTLTQIFTLIIVHWFADFVMQDEKWANGKSSNIKDLLKHTTVYSLCWIIPIYFLLGDWFNTILFVLITWKFHTTTDFFTSKIVKKKFENKHYGSKIPNLGAFSSIAFDQVLHYVQLFLTLQLFI